MLPHRLVSKCLLTDVPTCTRSSKTGEVVAHLTDKRHDFKTVSYIYVLEDKKLIGVVSIKELLRAPADTPITKIMETKVISTHPTATLERAAITAIQHGIKVVPVVERDGIFMGVIGTDTILQTLHREHTEDLLRIGGIEVTEQKHILEMVGDKARHLISARTPWLVLGLIGGFVSTAIVSSFENLLSRNVALAFFMPLVVYMSSAVGMQTQTIFIRASTVKKIALPGYIFKELIVDGALAGILGTLLVIFAALFTNEIEFALAVGIALVIAIILAGLVAILIPCLLTRFKKDPAIGAGPFGTVIQDILSLLIYFFVASLLL